MNITLLACRNGRSRRMHLHHPAHFLAVGSLAGLFALTVGAAGFWLGQSHLMNRSMASWQAEVANYQEQMAGQRETMRSEVEVLSDQVVDLRSRLARLDSVGSKLAETARIEISEFDFAADPVVGGPYLGNDAGIQTRELSDLARRIGETGRLIEDREYKIAALSDVIRTRELQAETTPTGWPVERGWISSSFGNRTDPITNRSAFHGGVDFAAEPGTPIYAVAGGVVTWSGRRGAYGIMIEIDHGSGYVTRYAHNKENLVRVGEVVRAGDKIGLVGDTGRSTGPHVHLEVIQDGEHVNPSPYASASR